MTPRDRRALMVGGVMALAALGARAVPRFLASVHQIEEATRVQRDLLIRSRRELGREAVVSDSIRELQRIVPEAAQFVIPGDSARDALRDLMSRLTLAVSREQARLQRLEAVAPSDSATAGSLERVAARVTWESDVQGVAGVLYELERDTGIVVVDLRVDASAPAASRQEPEMLIAKVTVMGWRRRSSIALPGSSVQ